MVSPKGDDLTRTPADHGSEPTRKETFMAKHGGILLPLGLLLAIAALMVYGMFAPR